MNRGLDDLLEWLLTEIGFSGLEGFSPLHLVKAVKTFYSQSGVDPEGLDPDAPQPLPSSEVVNGQEVGEKDIAQASVVWNWLTSRNDVIVGDDNRFKGISLKEALDLSGYVPPTAPGPSGSVSQTLPEANRNPEPAAPEPTASKEDAGTNSRRAGKSARQVTPRLHLSEERLWKAIAGHQPDLKRVPQFEWQALVAIASVREVGILQGDLVRLTNQDKRSLPTRTDKLLQKGYIVKQPVMLRGCRTSKIWLAQFAHHARQETINEGLASAKVDLSRETLTKNWDPVPFSHFWNGARVDHIALAQGFLAIVKAFGKIRYCDIRIKLDIVGKTSQMRAMGKSSRWFAHRGIVEFRPMKAPDSNRVFKDCVEFIRDPTAEEWQAFRKTPTTRMRLKEPSSRRKAKSTASVPDPAKTGSKLSRSAQTELKTEQALIASLPNPAMIRLSAWDPYKPLINTVFDIIKRSGTEGTSNLNIGYFLLGWPYRKWIFSMTTLLGQQRVHPEHMRPYSVTAQLVRRGKTMTYSFFATCNIRAEIGGSKPAPNGEEPENVENAITSDASPPTDLNSKYGFSAPPAKVFLRKSGAKYVSMPKKMEMLPPVIPSEIITPSRHPIWRTRKPRTSQPKYEEEKSEQLSETPTRRKRLLRGRRSITPSPNAEQSEAQPEPMEIDDPQPSDQTTKLLPEAMDVDDPQPAEAVSAVLLPAEAKVDAMPPPPLPSGVFYGKPNSLDPRKTKGRKRKSLVLMIRHPSLKKPIETCQQNEVRNGPTETNPEQNRQTPSHGMEIVAPVENGSVSTITPNNSERPVTPAFQPTQEMVPPASQEDASVLADGSEPLPSTDQKESTPAAGVTPHNKKSRRGGKGFVCETCGNEWKNSNGLEYHQKKSQSTCNPAWVPPPPNPEILVARRRKPKETPLAATLSTPSKSPMKDPKQSQVAVLPTKRPNRARVDTPQEASPARGTSSHQSTVLLNVGQIHSGPEPSPAARHLPSVANGSASNGEQMRKAHSLTPQPLIAMGSPMVPVIDVGPENEESNLARPSPYPISGLETAETTPAPTPKVDLPARATPDFPQPNSTHNAIPQAQATQDVPSNSGNVGGLVPAPTAPRVTSKQARREMARQRRMRTTSLIEELLRDNEGAFPGDHALHVVISSIWPRRFNDDIDPPDQKACDAIVKQMTGAKVLRQDHYGFKNPQGQVKSISVISKPSVGQGEEALREKILGIKEKAIELYPDPYIPPSLSMLLGGLDPAETVGVGDASSVRTALTSIAKGSVRKSVLTLDYHMPLEASTLARADRLSAPESTKRTHEDSADPNEESRAAKRQKSHEDAGSGSNLIFTHPMITAEDVGRADGVGQHADATNRGRGRGRGRGVGRGRGGGRGRGRGSTTARGRGGGQGPGRGRGRKRGNVALDDHSSGRPSKAARYLWTAESDLSVLWNLDADLPNVQRAIQLSESARVILTQPSDLTATQQDDSDEDDDEDTFLAEIPPPSETAPVEDSMVDPRMQTDAEFNVRFAPMKRIGALGGGVWPGKLPKGSKPGGPGDSFTMVGKFPTTQWFFRENLPQSSQEMLAMATGASQKPTQAQVALAPNYGDFLQNLVDIQAWELSSEGAYLQFSGTVAPEYAFISLGADGKHEGAGTMPELEWPQELQYTAANLTQDIAEAPSDDEICVPVGAAAQFLLPLAGSEATPKHWAKENAPRKRRKYTRRGPVTIRRDIVYKTRPLRELPPLSRGRWNQRSEAAAEVGLFDGEHHLLVAFLVLKAMTGGVERIIDWGMLIRLFPQMSLSGLRRFWSKMGRERRSFIDAFNSRFPAAFMEAYEQRKLPPIDYDNLEKYDWKTLINWAAKLKTHQQVELPPRREVLRDKYMLQEPPETEARWRDEWFGPITSAHARIDGSASEPMIVPISSGTDDDVLMKLATSWIKALCNSNSRCTVGEDVRDRLSKLGRGDMDKKGLNALLERAVSSLIHDRVISRVKGKYMGQIFKLNNNFERRAEKLAHMEKFAEASRFKSELDMCFRRGDTMAVPLDANAGTVMAIINLQAEGRLMLEHVNFPDVPFGFEPSNYEGRMFPKSYYHFDVRLVPTDSYLYSEDIPMAVEANRMPVPEKGPVGEVPIWRDFFGNLETDRWVQYVCLVVFSLATKGPLNAKSAAVLLHPMVEVFEVNLIVQWIQSLGILESTIDGHGWTVGEWWWLIIGNMVDLKEKGVATA
ncbi:hypothetical protein PG987_007932 [Apiospora arundinis]